MKAYIDKTALIAEIERRIDEVNQIDKASYEVGLFDAYKIILSFLDTLEVKEIGVDLGDPQGDIGVKWVQEEPVSNDLEEAAFEYAEACKYDESEKLLCAEHFKAGAEWGKNQAKVEIQAQSMALPHGCPKEEAVSNDLEREIKHYVYDPYFDLNGVAVKGATDYLTVEDVADIAKHFAQWQKEQLIEKMCVFLESTDFCKYYNREFVEEFKKAMEDKS